MTEVTLHRFNIVTRPNRGNGIAVAQIMKTSGRQADRLHHLFIAVINGIRGNMVPDLIGEYKAAVLPKLPPSAGGQGSAEFCDVSAA